MISRELRMIYREIPATSPCKSGCSDCCGPVPWSEEELARVRDEVPAIAAGIEIGPVRGLLNSLTGKCPFASAKGCQVYDRRRLMCRLFATSIEDTRLRCPHGVRPERSLPAVKARTITDRHAKIHNPN